MTETIVKTPFRRELTVETASAGIYLGAKEIGGSRNAEVKSFLTNENATELGTALLAAAAGEPVNDIGELPAVTVHPSDSGYLRAGTGRSTVSRRTEDDPAHVMAVAKGLFAIAKELQKREDAKVAEKKASEAAKAEADLKLNKRRDEVVKELTGDPYRKYGTASTIFKAAIDKIIELEGKVSKPKVAWF